MGKGDNGKNLKVEKVNDNVQMCLSNDHFHIQASGSNIHYSAGAIAFWTGRLYMNGRQDILIC